MTTSRARDFSLRFSRALGQVVIHVHGRLDADTAHELKHRLVDVIDGQGNRHVVLDLKAVTFIDSAGFAVLVDAQKRTRHISGQLVLSGPTPDIDRALRAAHLDKVFVITPSFVHPAHGDSRIKRSGPVGWERSG